MPIYGYQLMENPWELEKNISEIDLLKYIKIIKTAESEFPYKRDNSFLSSIHYNLFNNGPYVAEYDFSKSGISDGSYIQQMFALINQANALLNKQYKYQKIKFDIMGSWTIGRIIVMRQKIK